MKCSRLLQTDYVYAWIPHHEIRELQYTEQSFIDCKGERCPAYCIKFNPEGKPEIFCSLSAMFKDNTK